MLNHLVAHYAAREVANDLSDVDHDAAGVVGGEALRLDVRVDLAPLSGLVFPHRLVALHEATVHAVGPVHVGVIARSALDVAIVERPRMPPREQRASSTSADQPSRSSNHR